MVLDVKAGEASGHVQAEDLGRLPVEESVQPPRLSPVGIGPDVGQRPVRVPPSGLQPASHLGVGGPRPASSQVQAGLQLLQPLSDLHRPAD